MSQIEAEKDIKNRLSTVYIHIQRDALIGAIKELRHLLTSSHSSLLVSKCIVRLILEAQRDAERSLCESFDAQLAVVEKNMDRIRSLVKSIADPAKTK